MPPRILPFPARGGSAVGASPDRLAAAGGQQSAGGGPTALHPSPPEGDCV